MRVAVFASGGGTNLQALFDTCRPPEPASVVLVVSEKPASGALKRAQTAGVATHVIDDPTDGEAIVQLLLKAGVDLVVLAGYLKHVPVAVVREYDGRMINVHPALLPSFGGKGMYGIHVHQAVIQSGAAVSGVTIHLVNEEFDRGAPLAQWPVPVLSGDTPETLAARTLEVEHQLLPLVVLEAARHGKPVRLLGATEAFSGAATHELDATLRPS